MSSHLEFDVTGAHVLWPDGGMSDGPLSVAGGVVADSPTGRQVDLTGYRVLPGIVDLHGDGFERHMAPRRGAMTEMEDGVIATGAELAANGITTGVMAQFYSWEGGLRSPEFAARVFGAIQAARPSVTVDLIPQLRFETNLLDDYDALPDRMADWGVDYVVFNDHLPHDRLAAGRRPKQLTGQALKAGRSPDAHWAFMAALHARNDEVPAALDRLTSRLSQAGIRLGSHDDHSAHDREVWRARGAVISEFPETEEAAQAARDGGDGIILGSPNLVRGGSHKGNASARDLVAAGLCDALASDYHYPSPRRAVLKLVAQGMAWSDAWPLVSDGPARLLGLDDRGRLAPGLRADLVILDADTGAIAATFVAGRVAYMTGDIAARFFG